MLVGQHLETFHHLAHRHRGTVGIHAVELIEHFLLIHRILILYLETVGHQQITIRRIHHNRISAARCILPVSKKSNIPGHYGLRHRAAIGVTEDNDCIAIVVSEETGNISIVTGGEINTILPSELKERIEKELKA